MGKELGERKKAIKQGTSTEVKSEKEELRLTFAKKREEKQRISS